MMRDNADGTDCDERARPAEDQGSVEGCRAPHDDRVAAHVLALSPRQVRRLLERLQTDGAAAMRHKVRGQPSNNRISRVQDYALRSVQVAC